jgi:hypothetical protein
MLLASAGQGQGACAGNVLLQVGFNLALTALRMTACSAHDLGAKSRASCSVLTGSSVSCKYMACDYKSWLGAQTA